MTSADVLPNQVSARFNEQVDGLAMLPTLVKQPFGRLYGNYLFYRMNHSIDRMVDEVAVGLREDFYRKCPVAFSEKWSKLFALELEMLPKMLADAQAWANRGVLYRFLVLRFVTSVGKAMAILQTALEQLAARADAPFTYAELDDAEEQAFSNAFSQTSAVKT